MMGHFNYKPVLKWTIAFAIFVFLGKMVWDHWSQVRDTPFTLQPFPFILSTFIFAFSYFIQVWAWYLITLRLGIALSPSESLRSWFYSQLGKYLPGKVWLLLGRFYFYESRGKSKEAVSVALYLEMATMIMAAGLVFLAALIFHKEIGLVFSWRQSGWMALLFLLGLVSLHPRVLQKILNGLLVRLNREPISLPISYSHILWILSVCIVCWVVGGIGFYFFVESVYPGVGRHILFLTGALAIASTLGLVAVFAPSGLGVREGALVYLLSFVMATPVAVILTVLSRIWMTLIEIGLIGVVYFLHKFRDQHERKGRGETKKKSEIR
jgi:hypothetical protein